MTYDELIALTEAVRNGQDISQAEGRDLIRELQNWREFRRMVQLSETLLQKHPDDATLKKAYCQALIDTGKPVIAREMLTGVLAGLTPQSREYDDLHGLLGRANKDVCLTAANNGQVDVATKALDAAFAAYAGPYAANTDENYYHGINQAALLHLADRLETDHRPEGEVEKIAADVLASLEHTKKDDVWARATRVEAEVALKRWEKAEHALKAYVESDAATAFQFESTLRQLRDIWKIGESGPEGRSILRVLEAAALTRGAGNRDAQSFGLVASAAEVSQTLAETDETEAFVEKVFGPGQFTSFKSYREGLRRAMSVAAVLDAAENRVATAFAVRPEDLGLPPLEPGLVSLMTNFHVMNRDGLGAIAQTPQETSVRFEALSAEVFPVREVLDEHPFLSSGLDFTIFTIEAALPDLEPMVFNLRDLPPYEEGQRVYVIGHPDGRELQFSLDDAHLLDHECPKGGNPPAPARRRLHYFTPTMRGSSGSPVFNEAWHCIALHHAGREYVPEKSPGMEKLNGKEGRYSANQGIWIGSIREHLAGKAALG